MKKLVAITLLLATSAFGWGDPQNLGNPPNGTAWDFQSSIDGAGNKIFFVSTRNTIGKIFVSECVGGSWTIPQELPSPINEPGSEHPFWDEVRNDLYFTSADHGGYGGADLFVSHWNGSSWETPQNLGPNVNTSAKEHGCCLSSNGNRIYFAREGIIYTAEKVSGNWVNVQLTGVGDGSPTCYHDGYLWFASNRVGGLGGSDIWRAQGEGTNFSTPQNLGPDVNTSSNEGYPSWTSDGRAMYFDSNRPGGFGSADLWRVCYYNAVTPTSFGQVKASYN
ncbi:MAG: PD40 domain-containing protein [Candidatus Coatesbacteria bacterium]|nr:MAG: PD40 domain-containing protein [Candidatus Coatesbacteria bacterium]